MEDIIETVPVACGEKGCPVGWHLQHYWVYDDGTYSVCDSDGNHDGCDENDVPTADQAGAAWRDYSAHVLETGLDPVGEFNVARTTKRTERWQFVFSRSILGVALVKARHAGREYTHRDLPKHAADYVGANPKNPRISDYSTWDEFAEAIRTAGYDTQDKEVRAGKWFTARIEHSTARPEAAVKRDLRAAAKRHLNRKPQAAPTPVNHDTEPHELGMAHRCHPATESTTGETP